MKLKHLIQELIVIHRDNPKSTVKVSTKDLNGKHEDQPVVCAYLDSTDSVTIHGQDNYMKG